MPTRPVLCALGSDDGPRLVEAARGLADDLHAPLRAVHVVAPPVAPVADHGVFPGVGAPLHGTAALLDRNVEDAHAMGTAVLSRAGLTEEESMVAVGEPAEAIVQLAAELDARLIAACTRGRGPLAGALMGSVSRSLVRRAGCPVMIVRADHRPPAQGPVVCGLAAGRADAQRVVEQASGLAGSMGRPLVLAHVLELVPVVAAGGAAPVPAAVVDDAERREAHQALERAAADAGAPGAELVMLHGSPDHELDRFAAQRDAAMIVVGCRGHGNLRAAFAGSVSLDLAQGEGCPVAVVGPHVAD